jgi:AcrR family transcriptional regulator
LKKSESKAMPPKAGLNKSIVVNAAADLVNAVGLDRLSLNRLADKLGVQTPSLYNHIDGLPGLQRELGLLNARRLGDLLEKAAVGKAGPEAIRQVAQAYRAYIKGNPGVYRTSLRASGTQPQVNEALKTAEERIVETGLAVVASFGLYGEAGLHAVRGLRSVVHGFATLEIAGSFGLPLDCDESFRRLIEMLITGLQKQQSQESLAEG